MTKIILLLITALSLSLSGCSKDNPQSQVGDTNASEEVTTFAWKMVTAWPKNFPGVGMTAENIAKDISTEILILFWQFTIKTLEELDIVSNQNFSIDMK